MNPFRLTLAAIALAAAFPSAQAAGDDLKALREEIARMRENYEKRIDKLEQRLAQAESAAGKAVVSAESARQAAQRNTVASAASGFNPEVSLILGGALTRTSRDPADWKLQGFATPGEPDEIGPAKRRGYSLGESELVISANVDPNFRGYLNLALTPENTLEVEEAYFQTLGLGQGLTLKGGRFLSGIGYQNEHHPHAWDFADAPLAYTAFFGNRLTAEGLQMKWLAPTDLFLEVGAEAGRDDAFPGSSRNKKGSAMGSLFAHVGGDVGVSNSWRAGLSFVRTSPQDRVYEDTDTAGVTNNVGFSGRSKTWVADFVWKWAPNGNATEKNFKFQSEYFRRTENGTLFCEDPNAGAGPCTARLTDTYSSRQSGFYAQGVYQFMPKWRVGYRYDQLNSGGTRIGLVDNAVGGLTAADFPLLGAWKPKRSTLMMDYSSSEFSRLRLQFARDTSRGPGQADNQVWLQYIMSLGSHGAHKF
ncbi:MAG: hypothetical protein EG825_13560 [Rhodocyclaceae bacterium]|nr:hypothetical protein [Rhodocyclaceae bacterium]